MRKLSNHPFSILRIFN